MAEETDETQPLVYCLPNDATEPTVQLHLTLEESGELCHMVMRHWMELRRLALAPIGTDVFTPTTYAAMADRAARLWNKLARGNDGLMGKAPGTSGELPTHKL